MKRIITICLLLAGLMVGAQSADKNTWISSNYLYADEKPGIKRMKGEICIAAFNESAVAFYSKQTGLIVFNYRTVPNDESDTLKGIILWTGMSKETKYDVDGKYIIKFQYGKYLEIQQTTEGPWYVRMENIKRSDQLYSTVVTKYKQKNTKKK